MFCRKCGAQLSPRIAEKNINCEVPAIEVDFDIATFYRQLEEIRRLAPRLQLRLDGTSFDPDNPTSVKQAVATWEGQIDSHFAPYRDNHFIELLIVKTKASLHDWVSARVAEARGRSPLI